MLTNPVAQNESERLRDLYEYQILDTPPEEDFDEIVRLASRLCNAPISLISLVDAHRLWYKSACGLAEREGIRNVSFCQYAIGHDDIFVVKDTLVDQRFSDNPMIHGESGVRFYAGVPLVSPHGHKLGTLCIIDRVPRNITPSQQETLAVLGRQVVKLMELHKTRLCNDEMAALHRLQQKEMTRLGEMQQRVLSILAHDFRNPLLSLRSLLRLMPDQPQSSPHPALFREMAHQQLQGALGLVDNLVEWGRLQMRTPVSAERPYALRELVQDLLKDFQAVMEMKGLVVKNRVDPSLELRIDKDLLIFILRNLVDNSLKFTRKGCITVDAVLSQYDLLVRVEDTGIGMPPPILNMLFHGQKRIARKGTLGEQGSGLGLSLVREFIEKAKGSLQAESQESKGSSVTFTLPLR